MFTHSLINLKQKIFSSPFYISGLFLVFSVIFLFIFFNKISHDSLTEQIQHRQQVIARAGSKSIASFLNTLGSSLVTLSNNPSQRNLDQFINLWAKSDVTGVIVTNKAGIVTRISNVKGIKDLGADLSSRSYFDWTRTAKKGEYKVFAPIVSKLGASEGKYVIPIAVPLFDLKGNFDGALVVVVTLSDLTDTYLNDLKVLDSCKIYLVTSEGEIVYSDYPELTGKNFNNIFENDFLGKEKVLEVINEDLKKNEEAKFKIALPNKQNNFLLEPYLISSAPISVSNEHWKIVIVTPEKDLTVFTYKTVNYQVLAVFIIVTLFIILTLRSSRNSGYQQAVVDEHKHHKI